MRHELAALRHQDDTRGIGDVLPSQDGNGSNPSTRENEISSAARDLLESGYFDPEYYAASVGKEALTGIDAATHYLRYGSRADIAPHPLIEPEYIPVPVRDALKGGAYRALLDYLSSSQSRTHAWGPVFDPRAYAANRASNGDRSFLFSTLTAASKLPVSQDFEGPVPTFAEVREAGLLMAARTRTQVDTLVPAKRPDWDEKAEREWILRTGSRVLKREPVVSIVMAALNRENVIRGAIESVLRQSYRHWELIVVDDGSTDATAAIVRELAQSDTRIRLLERPHGGVSRARNAGLRSARGELIAFLDTDNLWRPRFLELSVKALDAEAKVLAVYAGMRIETSNGSVEYLGAQVSVAHLAKGNAVDLNTVVARATAIQSVGEFDASIKRWVDYDLILRLSAAGELRYLPFVGCDYDDRSTGTRITTGESRNWQFVPMGKHLVDWEGLWTLTERRIPGRVSIVVLTFQEHRKTRTAVDAILRTTGDLDVEVILVDNGSRPAVSRSLSARYAVHPRVSFHRLARNYNFAIGANYGFSHSSGEFVMFINNDTEVRPGWLQPLLERIRNTSALAVQPLLTYPNGTIQTAGTVFMERRGLPVHFLAHHPQADAVRHGGVGLSAITAGAMLVRAETFVLLRGFDPIFVNGYEDVDFCLRARARLGGQFEVESRSVVVHEESQTPGRFALEQENQSILLARWSESIDGTDIAHYRAVGFDVPHTKPTTTHARPLVVRPRREELSSVGAVRPSLRWAIKIGAAAGTSGDKWGDVPFAADLGSALEGVGQEVVIDRHGAFVRPTSYLDDVALILRGRHPVPRQAGRLNVMWVISRPDLVTIEEIRACDLVYAASPKWAKRMSELSGREVRVLLQATNGDRFNPDVPCDTSVGDVVFVGGARTEANGRPAVSMALAAGADLQLWGPGWAEFVAGEYIRGDFLEFSKTPAVYRSAGIVLNDHWADMAEWGFINNRTFDAVAAGTPVITDPVDGLEIFGGAVVACDDVATMRHLLKDRSWEPNDERMSQISLQVRDEHSFKARAAALVDDVLRLR
ncbi:glycosyltransferase [Cellulosimicrobium cellulans]|uniref:glycosyltransferase n=1 Tax=Cellulosimicrobium cellulans TaxID=1710 RepID=UPI0018DED16C|nr:glycosyltransferase [Cellulosimicrobium cellulans]